MKTLAAVSYEPGKPLQIEELELDEPKKDDVLIKMSAMGLCHFDYHALVGNRPVGMRPMVSGRQYPRLCFGTHHCHGLRGNR